MPENLIERNDMAETRTRAENDKLFPMSLQNIQENFSAETTPIFIFNVSPLEFNEPRYPNHPHMWIKPCPADKEYVLCNSITHPFAENYRDENGNLQVRWTNGYKEATRMLSPANPGTDQNYSEVNPMNVNGNLNNFGVFWSATNPPSRQELEAAKARLAKTFKAELAEMSKIESGVGGTAEAQARANNISHAAANFYGLSTSWHRSDLIPKSTVGKMMCGACGEEISAAAKICRHCNAPTDKKLLKGWLESRFQA